jgi:hypothetical protein
MLKHGTCERLCVNNIGEVGWSVKGEGEIEGKSLRALEEEKIEG